jgi:hypothetical protein
VLNGCDFREQIEKVSYQKKKKKKVLKKKQKLYQKMKLERNNLRIKKFLKKCTLMKLKEK